MNEPSRERVRDIFLRVVELSPADAAIELERLCDGDTALKSRVQELLDSARNADAARFMDSPTAPARTDAAFAPIAEGPGSRVGPYKILQLIGEGGFGSVFLAEQDKPVRRRVALKIIKLGMDTRQIVARFEQERQALALMDHPCIAKVHDAGSTDTGRPYFVMEYVKGDPITDFAEAHRLTLRDRLELFTQVCQAVQHAHTKGVIHRDIKPRNVLVSMIDGRPQAKVIDFGIAKATGASLTDKTLFTEHQQLIGTPEYMSPEQAEGSLDIDTRTDVYSLGVLLYELLTGATPFDARRLRSAAWDEMRRIIREEEPPTPSVRLERRLNLLAEINRGVLPTGVVRSRAAECDNAVMAGADPAAAEGGSIARAPGESPASFSPIGRIAASLAKPRELHGELDWIAMKALDKDRARRYETPSALAADVQRHLMGEAVVAAPPSAAYRLRKFARRNRAAVLAGSAVATALVLGIAGTTMALLIAQYNADVAFNNAKIAEAANAQLQIQSEDMVRAIVDVWSVANPHMQGISIGLDRIHWVHADTGSPGQLMLTTEGEDWRRGILTVNLGQMLSAQVIEAIRRQQDDLKRARLAEASLIVAQFLAWDTIPATYDIDQLALAVSAREQLRGPDHLETVVARWIHGIAMFSRERRTEGLAEMRRAASDYERLFDPDDRLVGMYENLLQAEAQTGNVDAASAWLHKLLDTADASIQGLAPKVSFQFSDVESPFRPRYLYDPMVTTELSSWPYGNDTDSPPFVVSLRANLQKLKDAGIKESILQSSTRISLRHSNESTRVDTFHAQAVRAASLFPDDERAQRACALAKFRMSQWAESLSAITRASSLRSPTAGSSHPIDLALLAMCHHELGRTDEARVTLAQLRALMVAPPTLAPDGTLIPNPWAEDADAKALLAEAEALIEASDPAELP